MIGSDVADVAQNLFGDSFQIVAIDELAISAINEAMRQMARETLMFTGTITSTGVLAVSGLNLASTTDFILCKRALYNGVPLAIIDQESLDRMFLTQNIPAGTPQAYYIDGFTFYLFPTPVAASPDVLTIQYAKYPARIDALSDTLEVPPVWETDLVDYVTMRFHERNENWQAANQYMAKWTMALSNRKFEGASREDSYRTVGIDVADMEYGWSEYQL